MSTGRLLQILQVCIGLYRVDCMYICIYMYVCGVGHFPTILSILYTIYNYTYITTHNHT